jgi:hypothetical protein
VCVRRERVPTVSHRRPQALETQVAAAEAAAAVAVRLIQRQVTRAQEERSLVRALAMRAASPDTSLVDTLTAGGWADVPALLRWAAAATAAADDAIATAEARQAQEQAVRACSETRRETRAQRACADAWWWWCGADGGGATGAAAGAAATLGGQAPLRPPCCHAAGAGDSGRANHGDRGAGAALHGACPCESEGDMLGDAKSSLGDAKRARWVTLRARWVTLRELAG